MSYHDDELAPPNGDFPDALIRAASLSALLLTACSDPKPTTPTTGTATELVRPTEHTPEFKFIQPPARDSAQPVPAPSATTHTRATPKNKVLPAPIGAKKTYVATAPAAIGPLGGPAQLPDDQHADDAQAPAAPTVAAIASDVTILASAIEETVQATTPVSELAGEMASVLDLDNSPRAEALPAMSSAIAENRTAPDENPTTVESTPVEPTVSDLQAGPELQVESTNLNSASMLAEPIQAPAETNSATATETLVAVTPDEEPPPEYVYEIIETAPTAPVRTITPEAAETLSAVTDDNGTLQLTRATETAPEPMIAAALATPKTKRKLAVVPKELSSPPVAKEHNNAQVELLQPVPNKVIVRALTAAIAAAAEQDNAYQPEPPPPVEDADDAEWEARMQTSQAPTSIIEMPARAPRNLTGTDFVQNGAKDVTGNSVTLNIAALGDAPINGYFVAESIGNSKPKTPKSNDPNWQEIEPVSVYGTEQTYTLKQSYADSTPVNLHVWFKDTQDQVSPAVHSKIALHRADTVISDEAPYIVDAALGFKDWIYQRGASQMGSAPQGRAKARADADNYLLSPPLTLPQTKNDATLILALRQWYHFSADANVSDGARATLEIAMEQLPGQWSDWVALADGDKSTSTEWTAPRFDLSDYAGITVKLRVGVAGSLHALADWGLSELSIAPEKPIQILAHSAYAQGFEADWNGWSSRLPQWSLTGPSLDGKILASEGLYHAAAKSIGLGTGEFTLNSPMFQLPSGPVDISFSEWHSLGHGEGRLQISFFDTNTGWRPWEDLGRAITGRSATWQTLQADLTPYAGKKIRVRILARLTPSDSVMRIDEFLVVAH